MFDVLFLGTSASVPSRRSTVSGIMLRSGKDTVLLDCGEGTQRQIMLSPMSFMRISGIFITHMHGDHFYGLAPLLQTMSLMGRRNPILLRGPDGFTEALRQSLAVCPGEIGYAVDAADMSPGDGVGCGALEVTAFATSHGIPSLGFVVREPDARGRVDMAKAASLGVGTEEDIGRVMAGAAAGVTPEDICGDPVRGLSVAYTGDTGRCAGIAGSVRGCDLLIHESTFLDVHRGLAETHFHSTARLAAEVQKEAGCAHLVLTHFSNRYDDRSAHLQEAARIFPETYLASDLARFRLTHGGFRSV